MEQIWYIEKNGRRRRAIAKVCDFCGKEYHTRKRSEERSQVYCSVKCRSEASRNREQVVCAKCGSEFDIKKSAKQCSRSGLYFCSRKCKDESQRLGGIAEIMPPHYGTAERAARETYLRIYLESHGVEKLVCERCGYAEFECGIDIHHLDGNHSNNEPNNLSALCAPCHRALHRGFWTY